MKELDNKGRAQMEELAVKAGGVRRKGSSGILMQAKALERFTNAVISHVEMLQKREQKSSLVITGYNAEGEVVTRGFRTTQDAAGDYFKMDSILTLDEAHAVRGLPIPPTKVGSLWLTSNDPTAAAAAVLSIAKAMEEVVTEATSDSWMVSKAAFEAMAERIATACESLAKSA